MFSWVKTCKTPGIASAAVASIRVILPFAIGLEITAPIARSGTPCSAAHRAWPVTSARPSTRLTRLPMIIVIALLPRPSPASGRGR